MRAATIEEIRAFLLQPLGAGPRWRAYMDYFRSVHPVFPPRESLYHRINLDTYDTEITEQVIWNVFKDTELAPKIQIYLLGLK